MSNNDGAQREAIVADITETRAQLGDTVQELTARLDVKARAREKLAAGTEEAKALVHERPLALAAGAAGVLSAVVALVLLLRHRH